MADRNALQELQIDRVYRPGMAAVLRVAPFGKTAIAAQDDRDQDPIDIPLHVIRATWVVNNHLTADELKLTVAWKDANVDPRFLRSATVQFWMGDAGDSIVLNPDDSNYRFIGICTRARRQVTASGYLVEMDFLDYTTMFLHAKPMPTRGVPKYDSTLTEAWRLICDNTGFPDFDDPKNTISNVAILRDRLVFKGGTKDYSLKGNVPARLAKLTEPPTKPGDSAWDVWQNTVASLGLISYIERDTCVVTSTTEQFTQDDAPVLKIGFNTLEADEVVDATVSQKGVALTAIDTTTGKVVEVFFPPPGDPRVKVKRSVARRKDYNPKDLQSEQYDYFEYHDVTNEDQLFEICKRAYAEKSRQEIQGSLKTREMVVLTKLREQFDLLSLGAGQLIHVEIDEDHQALLASVGAHEARVAYLVERGYEDGVADIISRNLEAYPTLKAAFHTKSLHVELSSDSFEIEIHYQNRIIPAGDTSSVAADEGIGNIVNNHAPTMLEVTTDNGTKSKAGKLKNGRPWRSGWGNGQHGNGGYLPPLPGDEDDPEGGGSSGGGGAQDFY